MTTCSLLSHLLYEKQGENVCASIENALLADRKTAAITPSCNYLPQDESACVFMWSGSDECSCLPHYGLN